MGLSVKGHAVFYWGIHSQILIVIQRFMKHSF